MAQSIMDYIFRRLALDYMTFEERSMLGIYSAEERQRHLETGSYEPLVELSEAQSLVTESLKADHHDLDIVDAEVSHPITDLETKDTHGSEAREVPAHTVKPEFRS